MKKEKILFIGSSLTSAFYRWFQGNSTVPSVEADFLICHGGYWVDALTSATSAPRYLDSQKVVFPREFEVLNGEGKKIIQRFYGSDIISNYKNGFLEVDLESYDKIIFSGASLYWDVSHKLYSEKFGIFTLNSVKYFEEAGLKYPLSESSFLKIHAHRFPRALTFLEKVMTECHGLKVYLAPAVLPSQNNLNFPKEWKALHLNEQELVFNNLKSRLGIIPMLQPIETLTDDFSTINSFMQDNHHHYNESFVEILNKKYEFLGKPQ